MEELFSRSLLVVTGKGGVGKSTVAAALGLAASRRLLRTIVVEVAARQDVARALGIAAADGADGADGERAPGERLDHISLEPERVLEEYLHEHMHPRGAAALLSRSRVFTALTAATPGLGELLTIGKVWELSRGARAASGEEPYDLVILDAPATGHGLAMLRAPRTFAAVARVGPVAGQAATIAGFLSDPARTAVVAVSTAEEMPVGEALELGTALHGELQPKLGLLVVNGLVPDRFSARELRTLRKAPPSAARRAALFEASWAADQRAQLARLRSGLPGVELVQLPLLFGGTSEKVSLERLSRGFG